MRILNQFKYFKQLAYAISVNKPFIYDEFYLGGSRKSGKTISICILFILIINYEVPLRVYIFRKFVQDIEQTVWEEVLNTFAEFGLQVKTNRQYRRIRYKDSLITFYGLHDRNKAQKSKLSGLSGANSLFKHAIVWFEEAYEFNQKDIEDVKEAIRGKIPRTYIYSFNPWSLSNWLVEYCNKHLPFNLYELQEKGYQFTGYKTKLFHYVNYQLNYYLSKWDIAQLSELEHTNPTRAKTACYGYFGIESGAIYSHALRYVSRNVIQDGIHLFAGGVDYGFRHDATTLILVAFKDNYEKIQIIKEYYHSNFGSIHKDHNRLASDIINTLINALKEFRQLNNNFTYIYVDSSNLTFIEILNNKLIGRGLSHLFSFVPSKKVEVYYRVQLQLDLMESRRMIVSMNCVNFWKELQLARWDETRKTNKPIPEDKDNHTQDAFHYATIPYYSLILAKSNPYMLKKSYNGKNG